jgi:glycosyltransferase involved in cell wall biosynthesis
MEPKLINPDNQGSTLANTVTAARRSFTVSLIIPTLNEAENLPLVFSYIPFEWIDEVILVDGQSTDNTVEMARSLLPDIRVVLEKQPGKGIALQAGYKAARGDILIVMDADGSNDPREIPRFIHALLQGADFVKGSRFAPQGGTTDMERLRQFGNWGFVKLCNLLFATQFTDLLYGYHAFWRYCLDLIDLTGVTGFEIDTALYLRAVRAKLRISDVPSFEGYRFHGDGKLKTFPDGWRVLKTILKEWGHSLRSVPEDSYKGFRSILPDYGDPSVLRQKLRQRRLEQQAKLLMNSGGRMLQNVLQLLQFSLQHLPEDKSYEEILPNLMKLTLKGLHASAGSIMILDDDGHVESSFNVQNGRVHHLNARKVEPALVYGLAGWVLETRQPAVVENTLEDQRWMNRDWELRKGSARSALGIPVVVEDRVRAVVTLTRDDGPFSEIDLDLERESDGFEPDSMGRRNGSE